MTDIAEQVREQAAKVAAEWIAPLRPGTEARHLGHLEAAGAIALAIRAMPIPSTGWQPIETAPMSDGDDPAMLLMRLPDGGSRGKGSVVFGHIAVGARTGIRRAYLEGYSGPRQPTHWMPLPAPPEDASKIPIDRS